MNNSYKGLGGGLNLISLEKEYNYLLTDKFVGQFTVNSSINIIN